MAALLDGGARLLRATGLLGMSGMLARGLGVLMYHDDISAETLRAQLRLLKQYARIIDGREALAVLRQPDPHLSLLVTFDDGHRYFAEHLYPVLAAEKVPAIVFVPTLAVMRNEVLWFDRLESLILHTAERQVRALGIDYALDDRTGAIARMLSAFKRVPDARMREELARLETTLMTPEAAKAMEAKRLMSAEQIRRIHGEGLVSFGGHTRTHPILSRLEPIEAEVEIAQGRRELAEMMGSEPLTFAYPNGGPEDRSPEVEAIVRGSGYRLAFTTERGINRVGCDPYALKRQYANERTSPEGLALRLIARALGPAGAWKWPGAEQGSVEF